MSSLAIDVHNRASAAEYDASYQVCSVCRSRLEESDICPDCEDSQSGDSEEAAMDGATGSDAKSTLAACVDALDNRWLIISSLIFVVGLAGLPILWRSRAFSPFGKAAWSLIISLESAIWWLGVAYVVALVGHGVRIIASWF